MTLQTLSLAAQLSLWSHLTDSVQSFMSSCITSQECQTHLIWPHMEQVGSVCSRGMAHRLLRIYLYQWGKPHLLGTDAVKARQTVPETTTNTRIALFISVQKNMQLSATASIHFPNRNVEIHPSSSTGLLPQAKVFTFSFAKNLWNSRHKSQSTKTNTSKPVLHSWQPCLLTAAFQVSQYMWGMLKWVL